MKKIVVTGIIVSLALIGCFSPWKGDEGTISISIGDSRNGRAGNNDTSDNPPSLKHTITLSGGPGQSQTREKVAYGQTVQFSVAPGQWDITITAFLRDKKYASGSRNVTIKPGPNGSIVIPMKLEGGTAGITIEMGIDIIKGKLVTDPVIGENNCIVISKSGELENFTVTVKEKETLLDGYIFNSLIAEGVPSITIEAKNYNTGNYTLVIVAWIDGIPYSGEIYFTVSDGEE